MVEALEARPVVKVAQMGELVAERADEARVAQWFSGRDVIQPDADRPIGVADPVAALHVCSLGFDRAKAQVEAPRDARCVIAQLLDQLAPRFAVHPEKDSDRRPSYLPRMAPTDDPLPLFPLPAVVLFPETRVPLHVFEPRYRQMMDDAVRGAGLIGMVTVTPEHQQEMAGDPPIFPVGCAGTIAEHERLSDGRYNLILEATHRFEVREELATNEGRLYRLARVRAIEERAPARSDRLRAVRGEILEALQQVLQQVSGGGAELDTERLGALSGTAFVNMICQALGLETVEKQGLLEAPGPEERAERLLELLHFQLASTGPSGGSTSVH